jgi:hypothetical protein
MDIDAGQRPNSGLGAASVDGAGPAGGAVCRADLASPWTPTEEAFWALVRDLRPQDLSAAINPSGVDADLLREVAPNGRLLDQLQTIDLTDTDRVDDLALLEVVAAWQRVVSHASAGLMRAAAALSRRDCLQVPAEPVPVGRGRRRYTTLRATGTEIAIRLGCSVRTGELLARDGRLFEGALAPTGDALERGEIDPRKARQIADRLADSPLQTALDVQAAVLAGAGLRSPAQVDRDLTRALVEVDPTEAEDRHRRARAERRVHHPRMLPDGMAGIWAVLPAESATLVDGTLDAAAAAARAAGDPRTLDQLRADGLVDLVVGAPAGSSSRAPGGSAAGSGAPGGSAAGSGAPGTPRRGNVAVRVDVTVALSTLMGLDDAPGDLAGYGAITAEQARALAAGGTWRRIVTDPLTGAVLDVGRTRYRPPAALRDHVVARDRICARPGCTVPAEHAELDHTVPFGGPPRDRHPRESSSTGPPRGGPPGTTSHENLAPLCAPDHTAKTLGVLHLEQAEPGVLTWTTATGLRVRVVPGRDGEATLLPVDPPPF